MKKEEVKRLLEEIAEKVKEAGIDLERIDREVEEEANELAELLIKLLEEVSPRLSEEEIVRLVKEMRPRCRAAIKLLRLRPPRQRQ